MADDPPWTSTGGSFRAGAPSRWFRGGTGWKKKDLVPYGKVDDAYRAKHYVCPECNVRLRPHGTYQYRFECPECGMLVGTGFGGLYAPAEPPGGSPRQG